MLSESSISQFLKFFKDLTEKDSADKLQSRYIGVALKVNLRIIAHKRGNEVTRMRDPATADFT